IFHGFCVSLLAAIAHAVGDILQMHQANFVHQVLRQIVATLTNNANVATLMLPIMNFNDGGMKKKTE
ncbi:hypothetical protein, partial [Gemmiger sp.]|uniref:hypothetical protein n=1 Tax=Gemmiger sp. TaxID=2049027 RepID=UPI003A943189